MTLEELSKMSPQEVQAKLLLMITEIVIPLKGDHLRTLALCAVADIWRNYMKETQPDGYEAFEDLVKTVRDRFGLDMACREAIRRNGENNNSSGNGFYN